MEKLSGHWHFIVGATKLSLNWMCEISALEREQTETKEHEVEIGSVSKRGGGSTSGVQGHHKPQHVSAQQCQQGRKFSTHWESISHREWRTWKEAYRRDTAILHLVLLDLEPSFKIFFFLFFFFFFFLFQAASASWGIQSSGASKSQTENLWPRKRDERGKEIVLGFTLE